MKKIELNYLLSELISIGHETEWIEFKVNYVEPEEIGEYISAISNSAVLHDKETGYIVWGIDDSTKEIVGTNFKPREYKVGNENLENWISRLLSPRIHFQIHEFSSDDKHLVLFEVPSASHTPVSFQGTEYIRVGSYKQKLKDYSEKERALWARFSSTQFENDIAISDIVSDDVIALIDYPAYFDLTDQPLPDSRIGILDKLASENIIQPLDEKRYHITNLGAILFAKKLQNFERLIRKAIRVIVYKGTNKIETLREQIGTRGYAGGFEGLIEFISAQLPQNEFIEQALRKETPMYPDIAIRELVANAIIHQDFSITGTGPMVEIFSDRVEITNPGIPLIDTMRFLDAPPRSRNDALASFMRRVNICEERGSGIDKVFFYVEVFQLPAPDFMVTEQHTRAILYGYKELKDMSKSDRIRACYQHAGLEYVSGRRMTNATLRKRLSISDSNYPVASRIIADTVDAGLIKPYDPDSRSRRHAKYIPFWA